VKARAGFIDQRFEKILSQTKQLRGRILSERVESNLVEFGLRVDCCQPVEVFNGTDINLGSVGEIGGFAVREDRVVDRQLRGRIILSVWKRKWPKFDVWLIFGSLLKFSMGLILIWEVFGEFG
jgi:hypothetical protein